MKRSISKICFLVMVITIQTILVQAQSTEFTYQGRLTVSGAAANGQYDLQFRLFDAETGGTEVSDSPFAVDNAQVTAGIFTVAIDFGQAFPLTGSRWLQIEVRPGDSTGAYTSLTPRQKMTAAPYAVTAKTASLAQTANMANDSAAVGGFTPDQLIKEGDARLTDARQPLAGSPSYVQIGPGTPQSGGFDVSGNGKIGSSLSVLGATFLNSNLSVGGTITGNASGLNNINPANISAGTAPINIAGVAANQALITSGTTPSAARMTMLVFDYASGSVLTDLTGGIDGQCVTLLSLNNNVSIIDAGNFKLSADWTPTADGTLTVCRSSASGSPFWYETSRSPSTSQFTLTVSRAGAGSGTVTSSPAGINCGADCSELYDSGTVVTLTAVASAGSTFTGWSGGSCSGVGTCVVSVTAATSVTATFIVQQRTLTVSLAGTGIGTVTSNPAGINCGADCTEPYNDGTNVILTASPGSGSTFSGWTGGGCSGTGTCVVTMTAATAVTATFTLSTATLTLEVIGDGRVTSVPAGIDCIEGGTSCQATYSAGTMVTLTAQPFATRQFLGWSGGGCSGLGTCVTTMDASKFITARFTSPL